jgi:ribonuclease HII
MPRYMYYKMSHYSMLLDILYFMTLIAGIDEVGRGPLAGPLILAIVWVPTSQHSTFKKRAQALGAADSKQLSPAKRARCEQEIKKLMQEGAIGARFVSVSVARIDKAGMARALRQSVQTLLRRACKQTGCSPEHIDVRLDGSLTAPAAYTQQKTIIKGDTKEPTIMLASILAKERRDRYMKRKAKDSRYAEYGFDQHVGYGTAAHREAIAQHGLSDLHRRSFCKNMQPIAKKHKA